MRSPISSLSLLAAGATSCALISSLGLGLMTSAVVAVAAEPALTGASSLPVGLANLAHARIGHPAAPAAAAGGVVHRRKRKLVRKRATSSSGTKACRAAASASSSATSATSDAALVTATTTVDKYTASVTRTATVTGAAAATTTTTDAVSSSSSSLAVQNGIKTGSSATGTSSSSSAAAAATSTASTSSSFTSAWPAGNGPFSGSTTYYDLGTDGSSYGACGTSLVDSDMIAAASYQMFDNWPGATANPNLNPICAGVYANVTYNGNSVVVKIEDRCPGCTTYHLDLSPSAFLKLAPLGKGIMDVEWEFVSGY